MSTTLNTGWKLSWTFWELYQSFDILYYFYNLDCIISRLILTTFKFLNCWCIFTWYLIEGLILHFTVCCWLWSINIAIVEKLQNISLIFIILPLFRTINIKERIYPEAQMVMGNKWLSDDSHYVFDLYRWPVKQDSNNIICPIKQEY